jgi:GntR family transcriptional regulator, transcriptional repressor for pyruvate dehydrogenase complex
MAGVPGAKPAQAASVFDQLLADIVAGRYKAGQKLPSERELSVMMGASRPTLREALRRLAEWGLIETRPNSGAVVRDRREWSFDVLPAYIRFGNPASIGAMVRDLFKVRRLLFIDVLRLVGGKVHGTVLGEARAAVARAWASRADIGTFLREDFEFVRAITVAADFLPALWMLNSLGATYLSLAKMMTGAAAVPEDYLASYEAVIVALEKRDVDAACQAMGRYLERHDRRVLLALHVSE